MEYTPKELHHAGYMTAEIWRNAPGNPGKIDKPYCVGVASWLAYCGLPMSALDSEAGKELFDYWACVQIEDDLSVVRRQYEDYINASRNVGEIIAAHIRTVGCDVNALVTCVMGKTRATNKDKQPAEGETCEGYCCEACCTLLPRDEVDESCRLYECADCGYFVSDSNRCESCNKFASRVGQVGCVECGQGALDAVTLRWVGDGWQA